MEECCTERVSIRIAYYYFCIRGFFFFLIVFKCCFSDRKRKKDIPFCGESCGAETFFICRYISLELAMLKISVMEKKNYTRKTKEFFPFIKNVSILQCYFSISCQFSLSFWKLLRICRIFSNYSNYIYFLERHSCGSRYFFQIFDFLKILPINESNIIFGYCVQFPQFSTFLFFRFLFFCYKITR